MNLLRFDRLIGLMAIVVIVLCVSNFYVFAAGLVGVSFQIVGAGVLVLLYAYLAVNLRVLTELINSPPIAWFIVLFFLIPSLTHLYAPFFMLRYVGYMLTFLGLFLTTCVWIRIEGWEAFSKWIFISWCVGIVGIVLSYFLPNIFLGAALLQESANQAGSILGSTKIADAGNMRAFGFYMQSNRACLAIVFHLIILLPLWFHNKPYWRLLILLVSFAAVLLTGSRMGFLVMIGLSGLLFLNELYYGVKRGNKHFSGFLMLPNYIAIVALGIVTILVLPRFLEKDATGVDAVERVVGSLLSGGDLLFDASVDVRLQSQLVFIDRIIERPLWGYGLSSAEVNQMMGKLFLSAHNNFLQVAYEYGVIMMLLMYGLLLYLCFSRQSKPMAKYFRFNAPLISFIVICVYSFADNTVFDFRVFPIVMAFMLMMLYFPKRRSHR